MAWHGMACGTVGYDCYVMPDSLDDGDYWTCLLSCDHSLRLTWAEKDDRTERADAWGPGRAFGMGKGD